MKYVDWMRKILRRRLGLAALGGGIALLAGCATTPTTSGVALTACNGLTAVVKTATALKPKLAPAVQTDLGIALDSAAQLCRTPTPPANANAVVAGILQGLNQAATDVAENHPAAAAAKIAAAAKSGAQAAKG